jgi:hypothetical protein
MAIIVAGRFETQAQAERVVQELKDKGFAHQDATTFFVNPPGQHDQFPVGGDQLADAKAGKAHVGAATGAAGGAALGAAAALAVPGIGPALALGVVALGAYTGSLAGTLAKLGDKQGEAESQASPGRHGGVLVAANVLSNDAEYSALNILRKHGASDIERLEGTWENGTWKDFDPVAPPAFVEDQVRPPGASRKSDA